LKYFCETHFFQRNQPDFASKRVSIRIILFS
jgi:hypothetical protein